MNRLQLHLCEMIWLFLSATVFTATTYWRALWTSGPVEKALELHPRVVLHGNAEIFSFL